MNAGSQILTGILMGLCVCILTACGRVEKERSETAVQGAEATLQQTAIPENYYTENSKVTDVMRDPAYGDYGHLIFPVDIAISEDLELKDVEDILPWYSEVNPKKTVEIVNYMKERVTDGEQIFYDIYSEEEKEADPAKEDTGLFFFRGEDSHCECRRRIYVCGGDARQLSPGVGTGKKRLQCLCADLPAGSGYSM